MQRVCTFTKANYGQFIFGRSIYGIFKCSVTYIANPCNVSAGSLGRYTYRCSCFFFAFQRTRFAAIIRVAVVLLPGVLIRVAVVLPIGVLIRVAVVLRLGVLTHGGNLHLCLVCIHRQRGDAKRHQQRQKQRCSG